MLRVEAVEPGLLVGAARLAGLGAAGVGDPTRASRAVRRRLRRRGRRPANGRSRAVAGRWRRASARERARSARRDDGLPRPGALGARHRVARRPRPTAPSGLVSARCWRRSWASDPTCRCCCVARRRTGRACRPRRVIRLPEPDLSARPSTARCGAALAGIGAAHRLRSAGSRRARVRRGPGPAGRPRRPCASRSRRWPACSTGASRRSTSATAAVCGPWPSRPGVVGHLVSADAALVPAGGARRPRAGRGHRPLERHPLRSVLAGRPAPQPPALALARPRRGRRAAAPRRAPGGPRASRPRSGATPTAKQAAPAADMLICAGGAFAAVPPPAAAMAVVDGMRRPGALTLFHDHARLLGPIGALPDDGDRRRLLVDLLDDALLPLGSAIVTGEVRGGSRVAATLRVTSRLQQHDLELAPNAPAAGGPAARCARARVEVEMRDGPGAGCPGPAYRARRDGRPGWPAGRHPRGAAPAARIEPSAVGRCSRRGSDPCGVPTMTLTRRELLGRSGSAARLVAAAEPLAPGAAGAPPPAARRPVAGAARGAGRGRSAGHDPGARDVARWRCRSEVTWASLAAGRGARPGAAPVRPGRRPAPRRDPATRRTLLYVGARPRRPGRPRPGTHAHDLARRRASPRRSPPATSPCVRPASGCAGPVGWGQPVVGRVILAVPIPGRRAALGCRGHQRRRRHPGGRCPAGHRGAHAGACHRCRGHHLRWCRRPGAAAARGVRSRQRASLHALTPFAILALDGFGRRPIPTLAWDLLAAAAADERLVGILPDARLAVVGGDPATLPHLPTGRRTRSGSRPARVPDARAGWWAWRGRSDVRVACTSPSGYVAFGATARCARPAGGSWPLADLERLAGDLSR